MSDLKLQTVNPIETSASRRSSSAIVQAELPKVDARAAMYEAVANLGRTFEKAPEADPAKEKKLSEELSLILSKLNLIGESDSRSSLAENDRIAELADRANAIAAQMGRAGGVGARSVTSRAKALKSNELPSPANGGALGADTLRSELAAKVTLEGAPVGITAYRLNGERVTPKKS